MSDSLAYTVVFMVTYTESVELLAVLSSFVVELEVEVEG